MVSTHRCRDNTVHAASYKLECTTEPRIFIVTGHMGAHAPLLARHRVGLVRRPSALGMAGRSYLRVFLSFRELHGRAMPKPVVGAQFAHGMRQETKRAPEWMLPELSFDALPALQDVQPEARSEGVHESPADADQAQAAELRQ